MIRTIYGSGYRFDAPVQANVGQGNDCAPPLANDFPSPQALGHFVEGLVQIRHRNPRQLSRAERHFRQCLKAHPNFPPALLQLAASLLAQYQWGFLSASAIEVEVEELLRHLEILTVMREEVLALRLEVLSLLNWQPRLADQRFAAWLPEQLPAGAPRHSWVRHLLACGRPAEALTWLEPELTSDSPTGWLLAAMAHLQLGEEEEAISRLRSQLRLDPSLAASRWLLAFSLARTGRGVEALQCMNPLGAESSEKDSTPEAANALLLALCGERDRAAQQLSAALRTPQGNLTTITLWGFVALSLGEEGSASRLLERAVQTRCGLAPFLWSWSLLPGQLEESQALQEFQSRMQRRFSAMDRDATPPH